MKKEILELVTFAKTSKNSVNKKIVIGKVSKTEAVKIKLKTGFNVDGYSRIIDKSSINHTLKNHGNAKTEKARGQIAVTETDFVMIPEIVKSENVIYAGKTKSGKDCLLYEYILEDVFYYVEEIRTGKKELCLTSMYKRKATTKR